MGTPHRERGRYASLSGYRTITGDAADTFRLTVVDRDGLPVMPLTLYHHLRVGCGPRSTADTYLGMLCPVFAFFDEHDQSWEEPPDRIEQYLCAFLRERLHLVVSADTALDGYRIAATRDTPLSDSGLRVLRAALRDFYRVMRAHGYYPYRNPMLSDLLVGLKREHVRHLASGGAPDHAGTRGESRLDSALRPVATFRDQRRLPWTVDLLVGQPRAIAGLNAALDAMLTLPDATLSLRDKAVLILLRYAGPRIGEVCAMTVGGYRSHTRDGVPGQVILLDKGSYGREVKTVHFIMEVQQALLAYLREERPAHDPLGRTRLSDLNDDDPFFLTEDGTPYTRMAFMRHWRKVYPVARKRCPIPFSPHTIRHLVVTELLLEARGRCDKTSAVYLDLKMAIAAMMGWRSPQTIDVYDHSLDRLEALGVLHALQESIRDRGRPRLRTQGDRLGVPLQSAMSRDGGVPALADVARDGTPAPANVAGDGTPALHTWFADRITGRPGP